MLSLAKGRVGGALIAEYSMSTSIPEAVPHVLAALAANAIESFRGEDSSRNIRSALAPAQIQQAAEDVGWTLATQKLITPGAKQLDAFREVYMIINGSAFTSDVDAAAADEKVKAMLRGMQHAVAASVVHVPDGVEGVRNMDVWSAKFESSMK